MTSLSKKRSLAENVYLSVRIGGSLHAIPIGAVEEVLPALPVERIAQSASFIRGVVYLRGHLIVILDGAERLGLPPSDLAHEPQIVCLRSSGRLIGMEIDEAIELIELPEDVWLPAEQVGSRRCFLKALADYDGQIVRILDPAQLLLGTEESELARISQ